MTEIVCGNSQFIRTLLQQGTNFEFPEIARQALSAGCSAREALRAIADYDAMRNRTGSYGLPHGFSSLFIRNNFERILVYTRIPSVLTGLLALVSERLKLSFLVPDRQLTDALRIIFDGSEMSVVEDFNGLPLDATFTTIVCVPPLGLKAA
jgi:hypothetical protein